MAQMADLLRTRAEQQVPGTDPMAAMLQLHTLKLLTKLSKRRSRDDSDSDRSEKGKGLKGLHRMRRGLRKHPLKKYRRYRRRALEILGVHDARMPWRYSDVSRRIRSVFGSMTGLWKVHYHVSEILTAAEEQNFELVIGMIVQLLKCIHQVALDRGSWKTAQMLLLHPDPTTIGDFGGDEEELELVHGFSKAMRELKLQHSKAQTGQADVSDEDHFEVGEEDEKAAKRKAKRVAAAKKKAEAKAAAVSAANAAKAAGAAPSKAPG